MFHLYVHSGFHAWLCALRNLELPDWIVLAAVLPKPVSCDHVVQVPDRTAPLYRSTVDTAQLQHAPPLKPLKIDNINFAGLQAQGTRRAPVDIVLI